MGHYLIQVWYKHMVKKGTIARRWKKWRKNLYPMKNKIFLAGYVSTKMKATGYGILREVPWASAVFSSGAPVQRLSQDDGLDIWLAGISFPR